MLVKHNPGASDAQIADVVSEWGDLVEERTSAQGNPVPVQGLGLGQRKRPKPP
jgi:hypothetical protein